MQELGFVELLFSLLKSFNYFDVLIKLENKYVNKIGTLDTILVTLFILL